MEGEGSRNNNMFSDRGMRLTGPRPGVGRSDLTPTSRRSPTVLSVTTSSFTSFALSRLRVSFLQGPLVTCYKSSVYPLPVPVSLPVSTPLRTLSSVQKIKRLRTLKIFLILSLPTYLSIYVCIIVDIKGLI